MILSSSYLSRELKSSSEDFYDKERSPKSLMVIICTLVFLDLILGDGFREGTRRSVVPYFFKLRSRTKHEFFIVQFFGYAGT